MLHHSQPSTQTWCLGQLSCNHEVTLWRVRGQHQMVKREVQGAWMLMTLLGHHTCARMPRLSLLLNEKNNLHLFEPDFLSLGDESVPH